MLERKWNVLALSDTKVKEKSECKFRRVCGVVSGCAREGVVLLRIKRFLDGVVEYREVSARLT